MARQKKIVPYVPNTKYPKRVDDYAETFIEPFVEADKNRYNLEWFCSALERYHQESGAALEHNAESIAKYYAEYFAKCGITQENMWTKDSWGNYRWDLRHQLRRIMCFTDAFIEANNKFLKEYDSRPDLQEVYAKFMPDSFELSDMYGMRHTVHIGYYSTPESEKEALENRERFKRPDSFRMFESATNITAAKQFIETNRPTPFQPGDFVRLRDPYVGHCDHDPLFASRWDVANGKKEPTPDKATLRIGTVMKVTDDIGGWRCSKGSKLIEVLWIGSEETTLMPEKTLRWETRPTKADLK